VDAAQGHGRLWEIARKAQVGASFHTLRHTCASQLLTQGVHPKVVQEMQGHSTIAITMDLYSHVTPSLQAEAALKMDAVLHGRAGRGPRAWGVASSAQRVTNHSAWRGTITRGARKTLVV
jgi:site-specific recombinase XerC